MNRTVSREKFLSYLTSHPAAVKKLVNPSEADLAECVTKSYRCMEFISKDKQTKKVISAYLKTNTGGYGAYEYLEKNQDIAATLPLDIVKRFINNSANAIKYFPQATKEIWLETAKNANLNLDFKEIPERVLCEELLMTLVSHCHYNFIGDIPEKFWTDTLITAALDNTNDFISRLPESVVTKKWVMYALGKSAIPSMVVPDAVWDVELAEFAADKVSMENIPERLRSKVICLMSLLSGMFDAKLIPDALWEDKEIQMAFVGMTRRDPADCVPDVKKAGFQLDTLRFFNKLREEKPESTRAAHAVVDNLQSYIKDWIPILKLCPSAISFIDKPNQTTEQIQAALQHRTEQDDLENIAKSLNLAKVTREMVPMLLNVEDSAIKDFVTRKLAPPKRADGADTGEFVVDVTPEEFRNISR